MDPNETQRPVYEEYPPERVEPTERARPVEYGQPVAHRRDVVQTDEASPMARVGQVIYLTLTCIIAGDSSGYARRIRPR
jgi:hypothetical protein